VPEDLYPWLNLASGLLVLGVGGAVLRARVRHRRAHLHGHRGHHHSHDHDHAPAAITRRSLVAMGASAGLIPCPSALVVLLAAVAQHRVALGLALIVAFSLGLAATLTALGLAVVRASALTARLAPSGRLLTALPAASALVIVAAGALLTAQAVPEVFA
jgi:ABC-type nickel/cobalt efflux system permease component RcnA